jgi:hypothetical protein
MSISRYEEQAIHYYNIHLLSYIVEFDKITILHTNDRTKMFIQGLQTMLHVLSIIYCIKMTDEQINSYLEKCPLLFIEYTEQVYLKQTDIIHTPSLFVYNVLLGNISFEKYICNNNLFMNNLYKWSMIINFLENKEITSNHRTKIISKYHQPYLLLFTKTELFPLCSIFEYIQTQLLKYPNSIEKYVLLLSSFLDFFKNKKNSYTNDIVKEIYYNKFMVNNSTFEEYISDVSNITKMNSLIKWVFSS